MSKSLHTLVKGLIIAGMLFGVALLVLVFMKVLPITARFFYAEGRPKAFAWAAGALAVLFVLGGEYIAWVLLGMMRTLDEDPFVERNVKALRNMGIAAFAMMGMGLLTLLLHPVPLMVLASLPVGMCGLFSLVLSGVFAKAVAYKQENDLTV